MMNEWLKKLFSQIKTVWSKGSTVQKVVITGIIIFVIGAIVFISVLSSSPSTVPLYNIPITDEDSRDRILIRLSEENIQATVNAAGIISVADEKTARKARTLLVREDLTPTNVSPWNLFDTERWTTTDFERNVNLLRSITNQVTQHIESLEEVDRANVVITRPERTLFAADQNPTTASVIIYHKPGSDILSNKKKLQGIQKLLLFAVEGLKEENITITDSNGNVLNDFAGMAEIDRVDIIAREQKLISTLETQYRAKVLSALQQIFTPDRVRDLNIKIDMNMSKRFVDATEYSPITIRPDNPDTPYDDSELVESITLSSETVTKRWTGTGYNPEGPAGAEGQTAPVYSDMSNLYGVSEETGVKRNEVINTKQIQEEISPSIDRISVSVNIDGRNRIVYSDKGEPELLPDRSIKREYIPLTAEELANTTRLVEDAIGYQRGRGDSVSVQNIQFDRTAQFAAEDAALLRAQQTKKTVFYILSGIVLVLLAFIIFRTISRELEKRRRLKEEELLRQHAKMRQETFLEAERAGMEVTMSVEERRRAELQENAIALAKDHPEDVAMLIRTWLMEE